MIDAVQVCDGDGRQAGQELMARNAAKVVRYEVENVLACFLHSDIHLDERVQRAVARTASNIEVVRSPDLWKRLIRNDRRIRQVLNDLGTLATETPSGFQSITASVGLYHVSQVMNPLR